MFSLSIRRVIRSSLLLLLLLTVALQSVQGQQRISQIKCAEYRESVKTVSQAIPLTLDPEPLVFESYNCSRSVDLIVGGEDAKEGEFPHQALLGWEQENSTEYKWQCGGSLISELYVLTAAHCSFFNKQRPVVVRLGEADLKNDFDTQVDIPIETIVKYGDHRFAHSYHDIALVKLKQKVWFSIYIRPACLWPTPELNYETFIATGFGHVQFGDEIMSETLRKVQLDMLDRDECVKQFTPHRKFNRGIINEQLCVGSRVGGRDTCQGDSGGPIQVITDPSDCTYYIVGVTSTGSSCGVGRSPAIYTRVSSYIDWIEQVVWPKN